MVVVYTAKRPSGRRIPPPFLKETSKGTLNRFWIPRFEESLIEIHQIKNWILNDQAYLLLSFLSLTFGFLGFRLFFLSDGITDESFRDDLFEVAVFEFFWFAFDW